MMREREGSLTMLQISKKVKRIVALSKQPEMPAMDSVLPKLSEDVLPPAATEDDETFNYHLDQHKALIDDIQYKVFTPDEVKILLEEVWGRLSKYKSNEGKLLGRLADQETTMAQLTLDLGEASKVKDEATSLLDSEKQEREKMTRMLDECHLREQDYQELVSSLRKQTKRLEAEIEKRKREHDELAAELGVSGRSKEAFYRDKERLKQENNALKEDIVGLQRMQEELAQRLVYTQTKLENTQHNLSESKGQIWELMRDRGHMSKEALNQRTLVNRLKKCLLTLKSRHDSLVDKLEMATTNSEQNKKNAYELRLENKELRTSMAAEIQDMNELNSKMIDMLKENQHLKVDNLDKDKELASARRRANQAEEKSSKTARKASRTEKKQRRLENKTRALETKGAATARGAVALEQEVAKVRQNLSRVTSDNRLLNAHLLRTAAVAQEHLKRLEVESQIKRSIELERDRLKTDLHKMFINNLSAISEKERLIAEAGELEDKVEETLLNVKHKETCLQEMTTRLTEETEKLGQAINLYELTKTDRDLLDMKTRQTRDNNEKLKRQVKLLSKQLNQLNDQLYSTENQLSKQEKVCKKKAEEAGQLELRFWRNNGELVTCKETVIKMEKELLLSNRHLNKMDKQNAITHNLLELALDEVGKHQRREEDYRKKAANLEQKLSEEVRLADLASAQSVQRMDDIKLLRLEVLKLRREKLMLTKAFDNVADFRKEIYLLNKELTNERIRNRVLENEMETPINFHRWRFLQGRDPEGKELVDKVLKLQKELSKAHQNLVVKDTAISEMTKMNEELTNYLKKLPGRDALESITSLQYLLLDKDKTIKSLSSELCCLEGQVQDLKIAADISKKEKDDLKKKYYSLKSKVDKEKQKKNEASLKEKLSETELPAKQFAGGGFNMAPNLPHRALQL